MKNIFLMILFAAFIFGCGNPKPAEETSMAAPVDTTPKPVEIADDSYSEMGKQMFAALSSGDMDKFMSAFDDNAMYRWNRGDSLAGKQAIDDFWRKRRTETLSSITFEKQIFLPVKVNQPQSVEVPGNWLLCWASVTVNYTGKGTMTQWMHWTIHFDDNKKIDRMTHYVDMVPVNAALAEKK